MILLHSNLTSDNGEKRRSSFRFHSRLCYVLKKIPGKEEKKKKNWLNGRDKVEKIVDSELNLFGERRSDCKEISS